jgi:hypothetical protein
MKLLAAAVSEQRVAERRSFGAQRRLQAMQGIVAVQLADSVRAEQV